MKRVKIQEGCYFCTLPRAPLQVCTFHTKMYGEFHSRFRNKTKKRVLNLHVIFVALEIQPPFFIAFYQGYQKKPRKNIVTGCI